jgi:hypothetical protein
VRGSEPKRCRFEARRGEIGNPDLTRRVPASSSPDAARRVQPPILIVSMRTETVLAVGGTGTPTLVTASLKSDVKRFFSMNWGE